MDLETLKYPIGKFIMPDFIDSNLRHNWLEEIEKFPAKLKSEVKNWTDAQLDTPYRPGGWSARQVVHHCADSHLNAYMRIKLALTEENPTIKPYEEALWAELPDAKSLPIGVSLGILEGIHQRWVYLLKNISESQWERKFIHPEHGQSFTIQEVLGIYAWHGNHHLAHIQNLRKRENWTI